ncbi:glycosyltransferase family 2 protein [Salinimicrobium oceani]|uniref:Glycosyltransferase family 2 protein n=1 Tax=Salinimicrobium oceani TaxID=2722702 RepID=A0ABX1D2L6_9FLAO|nr:glycosyltransferase family A protein [Salinimicrobium oceani]NJW53439.1 glycosyltransferase family 2 protein [Salinimicrobium oceani]
MISIVIPTYNRANFIARCINSVLKQTFEKWELLIIDDGSTDNTQDIVTEYLGDIRIRYFKKQKRGATHSRNVGVEKSTGEYITFLDSDDEAEPEWLESFIGLITQGAEVMCCGFQYYNYKGEPQKEHLPYEMGELYYNRTGRFTNGGVFLMKKYLFEQIGGYDEEVRAGQHSEMAIRLLELLENKKIKIYNLSVPLIKVHVHQDAKIRTDDEALLSGAVYVLNKHKTVFKKHKTVYANYLGVAAVSAARLGKTAKAKRLFFKAWLLNPGNVKMLGRYFISLSPMKNKLWRKNSVQD